MLRFLVALCPLAHVVDLEPDTGFHAMIVDCFHSLIEPLREQLLRHLVIAHCHIPRDALLPVPAAVDHKIGKSFVLNGFQNPADIFMGRVPPGRAILIEDNGKRLLAVRSCIHCFIQSRRHPLGNFFDTAAPAHRQNCRRCHKRFPRLHPFHPVPEIVIRQSAGKRRIVSPTVHLHLPARIVAKLRAPEDIRLGIFHHRIGKISIHRHGPNLPEPLAAHRVTAPRRFQL